VICDFVDGGVGRLLHSSQFTTSSGPIQQTVQIVARFAITT